MDYEWYGTRLGGGGVITDMATGTDIYGLWGLGTYMVLLWELSADAL